MYYQEKKSVVLNKLPLYNTFMIHFLGLFNINILVRKQLYFIIVSITIFYH